MINQTISVVKNIADSCDLLIGQLVFEINDIISHFVSVPDREFSLPQKVISIDDSNYEVVFEKNYHLRE